MKKFMVFVMVLMVSGAVYAGISRIEVLYQKGTGEVVGWNKSAKDFGQYNPKPNQSVGVFDYNQGEDWESVQVVGNALVPVIRPTPTAVPDLFALYTALEARVAVLEGL